MIDSGSQGNAIRINVLPPSVRINYHDKIWIKGISNEHLITIGTVSLKIFNQRIVFHVIQDELQIPYDGILGAEFLNTNKTIMDFNNKNLYLNGNTIPFKQNIGYCKDDESNKIFSVNQHDHKETLPLINIANRKLEYVGQFLLDTGSEGNLIKISSLPADCVIDMKNTINLKGISGKVISTLV